MIKIVKSCRYLSGTSDDELQSLDRIMAYIYRRVKITKSGQDALLLEYTPQKWQLYTGIPDDCSRLLFCDSTVEARFDGWYQHQLSHRSVCFWLNIIFRVISECKKKPHKTSYFCMAMQPGGLYAQKDQKWPKRCYGTPPSWKEGCSYVMSRRAWGGEAYWDWLATPDVGIRQTQIGLYCR